MSIQMIGIDHSTAEVEVRERFSFTRKKSVLAMQRYCREKGIHGCIVLSTCNRTEIWISTEEESGEHILDILCEIKELEKEKYRQYVQFRSELEAAEHLFFLASGLKSRIVGEDQIITQVREALVQARENYCTDNVLEVLFRMAVTGAKKVKSETVFPRVDRSVIHYGLARMEENGFSLKGRKCMVIGNGEMGRLAAAALVESGAEVTVTIRQYRSGQVQVIKGVQRINYGERMSIFNQCDLIISATASPNYTLHYDEVSWQRPDHTIRILDLAVPRDVEPGIADLPYVELYDIDSFQARVESEDFRENQKKAEAILGKQLEEFYDWYSCRDIMPRIRKIRMSVEEDLLARLEKKIQKLSAAEEEKEHLVRSIEQAADRVVDKMIFGLRDQVGQKHFRTYIDGMEEIYRKE